MFDATGLQSTQIAINGKSGTNKLQKCSLWAG